MITEFAPAKVNLGLAVLGRRGDGYHEIESLMATLDLGDRLTFEPRPAGVTLTVRLAEPGWPELTAGPDNLVHRAAVVYLEAASRALGGPVGGVRIELEKRLPIAAGLGGGSSDAAATLRGLARLYPAGLDLHALAARLGADAPFLVLGGVALARGVGEVLEPLALPPVPLVLANPGLAVPAGEAYAGLTGRFGPPLDLGGIVSALERRELPPYRNDLEPPVLERFPLVGEVKAALSAAGLYGVLMSGSGSTVFGLARDGEGAREAAGGLARDHPGWWVRVARVGSGVGGNGPVVS